MTIEWRYTTHQDLGVLSLAGFLGADAVARFTGAVGWALARGTGPVILDLTELRGWSAGGQLAVAQAARQLADKGRSLELAAIPSDGSLVPDGSHPPIPVHCDLAAALVAHQALTGQARECRTDDWPGVRNPAAQALNKRYTGTKADKEPA
ncbi:STAS domain-containing protein [Streptomyces sp. NBC_00191]|uniref:STAS domain-containing protein n=1 Tax=Streptomyces sp. NBC_00191 TaxID=2975674 RepID=UPI00324F3C55